MAPPLLRRFAVLLLLVAAGSALAEPIRGMPLLQRYTSDDYHADAVNHAVVTDADGIVYVANNRGLLRFDGLLWQLLELPGRTPARSLAFGRDGRLYIGGVDHIGRLAIDETGALQYEDLRGGFGLEQATARFGIVWSIVATADGVYFRTPTTMYFRAYDGSGKQWEIHRDVRTTLYTAGGEIYSRVQGVGLARFRDGRFEPVPGAELFADQPLLSILPREDGLLLVGEAGFAFATADAIRPLPSDAGKVFEQTGPYNAIDLGQGGIVLGTYTGELLHYSSDLHYLGRYPIGPYTVLELGRDREGGLWAATEGDLVRVRLPSPWSAFTAADGLIGGVSDSAFHRDALWVATSVGVYRAQQVDGRPRFERVIETALEAFALEPDAAGLLVGDREGVLLQTADDTPAARLLETDTVYDLMRSEYDDGLIYALGDGTIERLRRSGSTWQPQPSWNLDGVSLSAVIESAADTLWIGDFRGPPQRWTLDGATGEVVERTVLGAEYGIEVDPEYGTRLHELDEKLYVVSGASTYLWNGSRFERVDLPPFNRVARPYDLTIAETPQGTFAFTTSELLRRGDTHEQWHSLHLGASLGRGYLGIEEDADGVLRVLTWGGVLQYDPSVSEPAPPPLQTSLREVLARAPDGSVRRLPLQPATTPELPPDSVLSFDFALISMDPGSEFRFRIEGTTDGWTEWSPPSIPSLTMRSPPAGTYTVVVQGRTRSGRLAEPTRYRFTILPQWWQTTAARIGGLSVLLLLIALFAQAVARWRNRQYIALNRRLERKIAERTAELEHANRRLEELATEDSLTGVANRRALEQALLREWDRCAELGQPLAVIMVDVDHFKQFNDRHGHLEGDKQLVRVAKELAGRVRPVRELLARFGGEEFAIILPGLGMDEAVARAETMRAAFDRGETTTVSIGVASEVPTAARNPTQLLHDADIALYAAKRNGRNQVMRAAA